MSDPDKRAIIYSSQQHSVYVGRLERLFKRVNVPATLLVSLDDQMELIDNRNNSRFSTHSLLIPPGMNVSIDTHDSRVAMCFLDDLGQEFSSLIPEMATTLSLGAAGTLFGNLRQAPDIIEQAQYLSQVRPSIENAFELFNAWIGASGANLKEISDPRVAKAVQLIKEQQHENISVAEIAAQVQLSVPRLIQLFKQVTGTPIRKFRLWHRILATAAKLTEGCSMTEAAIAAGFSDYAQFSRVYRELAGGSPAAAKNNTEIRVLRSI